MAETNTAEREEYLKGVGRRIKERREALDITQAQLAEMTGYTCASSIGKIEVGMNDIPQSKVQAFARALKCSPGYISGFEEEKRETAPERLLRYPVIGTVRAGFGGTVDEIPTDEEIDIPADYLRGHPASDFFVLRVSGSSMYPRLLDGDKVLIRRQPMVENGEIAIVIYNSDEATVKKVHYENPGMRIDLIPFNPEYQTKTIRGADLNDCRIVGKVILQLREY